ncbi:MAG: GNAT family N-acetyltransferase [Saprospiraceae bacterium]
MEKQNILISNDKSKLDLKVIYQFLSQSYWANNRTLEQIEESIRHSICFGVYANDQQIGFARVITDRATFAYVADVFILPAYRGLGYSKQLMTAILSDTSLSEVNSWFLITKDAQGLYEKFGFSAFHDKDPDKTVMKMNK